MIRFILTPVLMFATLQPAWAAKGKAESYSAIDASTPVMVEDYSKPSKPKDPASLYETVPAQHADSIVKRLRVVEELIKDYGRAYDYRVHTTAELEGVLKQLKALKEPTSAKASPADLDESLSGFVAPPAEE